ncbi:MAG: metallophosphoesterase [Ignavibacteriales bacterium]|nr:metallophosphoesterase [Ignavibacteriales bacterium]
MPGVDLRFVHVSDLHIVADPGRRLHGVDTADVLRQAIPVINGLRADFVVAGGDLVSDEAEDSYRRLQTLLAPLAAPIHLLMGNHDSRAAYRRVFHPGVPATDDPVCEAFERAGTRFVLVDSTLPGKEEECRRRSWPGWKRNSPRIPAGRPEVFLHHQPLPIYVRWLDRLGLQNPEPFSGHPGAAPAGAGRGLRARPSAAELRRYPARRTSRACRPWPSSSLRSTRRSRSRRTPRRASGSWRSRGAGRGTGCITWTAGWWRRPASRSHPGLRAAALTGAAAGERGESDGGDASAKHLPGLALLLTAIAAPAVLVQKPDHGERQDRGRAPWPSRSSSACCSGVWRGCRGRASRA